MVYLGVRCFWEMQPTSGTKIKTINIDRNLKQKFTVSFTDPKSDVPGKTELVTDIYTDNTPVQALNQSPDLHSCGDLNMNLFSQTRIRNECFLSLNTSSKSNVNHQDFVSKQGL